MSENMIATCLNIGIFLMAGAVLVLTVIYFVKPGSRSTKTSGTSDVKQIKEQNTDKIQVKKTRPIKVAISDIKMPALKVKKIKKTKKEALPIVEATKTDNKEVIPATQFVGARPVEIDKTPKMVVKPEKDLNANIISQPVVPKNENHEQQLLKETPKAEVIISPPGSPKLSQEYIKPILDGNSHGLNENEKTNMVEAVKKESENKMDNKNVNTSPDSPVEKPQPITLKPAAPATNASVNKKTPEQKTSLNELSQMFSKETVDDSEATKLAKNMKEVEIDKLLKDGQNLINLLKRGRS
jgi:hypothetical protein